MDRPEHTRRRVLRAGAGLASVGVLGGLAGCQNPLGGSSSSSSRLDSVPSGSQSVAHADVTAILDDGALRDSANQLLDEVSPMTGAMNGSTSVQGLLDQFQQEAGLDLRDLSELLAFASFSPQPSAAMVAYTDWDEQDLVSVIESQGPASLESSTYGEHTVYATSGSTGQGLLGVLGEGTYAVGTQSAVHDAIDVQRGQVDPVSGTVRSEFDAGQSGYVRVATTVPESIAPQGTSDGQSNGGVIGGLTSAHGSMGRAGSDRRVTAVLEARSDSAAQRLEQTIDSGMGMVGQQARQSVPDYADDVRSILEATSVSRSGSSVTVEYVGTPRGVIFLAGGGITVIVTYFVGFGSQPSGNAPQAAFDFDYASDSEELTIAHTSGAAIPAGDLYVSGPGPTKSWATFAGIDPGDPVTAGMELTVPAGSADTVLVLHRSANSSTVLASWEGPDA